MAERYPGIEPYEHGMLDVGDGNRVYWEACGNPRGKPALFVHGGPGQGCIPKFRTYFDPSRYRIVLVDQRGCGRSTPHASEYRTDMSVNTTDHLVADFELLRDHLGVRKWLLFGGSWGSVLALVYALRHPDRISEIVLSPLGAGRRAESNLLTRGLGQLFPDAFARFLAGLPADERDGDLSVAYNRLLESPDPTVRMKAANDWCAWEDAQVPAAPPYLTTADPAFRMAYARLVTHYWSHQCWLPEDGVLPEVGKLAHIPAVLVQGSLDPGNMVGTPWLLAQAWPGSALHIVDDSGHSPSATAASLLVEATDRFATD